MKNKMIFILMTFCLVACGQTKNGQFDRLVDSSKTIQHFEKDQSNETVVSESSDTNEEKIYSVVEDLPLFDGKPAEIGFSEYVDKNHTDYDGVSARVFVEFIIEKDGTISNAKVLRNINQILDKEAIRVINASPKWTPAKVGGEAVRMKYVYPVTFDHYGFYKNKNKK